MSVLGIEPTVFRADSGAIILHDPVFKYDVTGMGNREEVQYHIMHNGKRLLWCVHDCLGNIVKSGFETARQALLALQTHLNTE